jgi:hypothetical protein
MMTLTWVTVDLAESVVPLFHLCPLSEIHTKILKVSGNLSRTDAGCNR